MCPVRGLRQDCQVDWNLCTAFAAARLQAVLPCCAEQGSGDCSTTLLEIKIASDRRSQTRLLGGCALCLPRWDLGPVWKLLSANADMAVTCVLHWLWYLKLTATELAQVGRQAIIVDVLPLPGALYGPQPDCLESAHMDGCQDACWAAHTCCGPVARHHGTDVQRNAAKQKSWPASACPRQQQGLPLSQACPPAGYMGPSRQQPAPKKRQPSPLQAAAVKRASPNLRAFTFWRSASCQQVYRCEGLPTTTTCICCSGRI